MPLLRIAAEVSDGEALTEDAGRQLAREVQWLLADRGILFAQTRTRHYPPRYNWQISVQAQASLPQAHVSGETGASHMRIPWHAIKI